MRDKISHDRALLLHPKVRFEVINIINYLESAWPANTKVRIVQGLRTIEEQNTLYAKGRTTPGPKVTNARGGKSYHNYGLAIDYVIMVDGAIDWEHPLNKEVIAAFKSKGWKWGGEFKSIVDKPHFEKSFGFTVSHLYSKYQQGAYVDI